MTYIHNHIIYKLYYALCHSKNSPPLFLFLILKPFNFYHVQIKTNNHFYKVNSSLCSVNKINFKTKIILKIS